MPSCTRREPLPGAGGAANLEHSDAAEPGHGGASGCTAAALRSEAAGMGRGHERAPQRVGRRSRDNVRAKCLITALVALHSASASLNHAASAPKSCHGGQYMREIPPVVSIAAGHAHTCSLHGNGNVMCWGGNAYGQLGYGDTARRAASASDLPYLPHASRDDVVHSSDIVEPRVDLGAGISAGAVAVAAGLHHTCAILGDGALKCWGRNQLGQLGRGSLVDIGDSPLEMGDRLPPVSLGADRRAVHVALGRAHTCVILDSIPGDVKCWGGNSKGQLGLGDIVNRGGSPADMGDDLRAVDLGHGRKARLLTLGSEHTCALLDTHAIKCWGSNEFGQLGLGDAESRGARSSDMGHSLDTVQLGTGRSAAQIAGGDSFTCARLDNGLVKCWGRNDHGQLGLGDDQSRGDVPSETGDNLAYVSLGTGRTARALAQGHSNAHMCAVLDNLKIKCWGMNAFGQLGLEDDEDRGNSVEHMGDNLPYVNLGSMAVDNNVASVSLGRLHTCVLLGQGPGVKVKCFGYNYDAQLGTGDTVLRGTDANDMGENLPYIPVLLTRCLTCPALTYSLSSGASSTCGQCVPASQSPENSSAPESCKCNAGYAGNDGGPCIACESGYFKESIGSSPCVQCGVENSASLSATVSFAGCECSPGFYRNKVGAFTFKCIGCPFESYSPFASANITNCACNAGFTGPGGGPCQACARGTYKSVPGSAICSTCPVFSSSNENETSTHVSNCSCVQGYHGSPGGPCLPCEFGKFTNISHLRFPVGGSCLDCPAHSSTLYTARTHVDECVCNAGFTGPNGGPCVACPTNFFKNVRGSSLCLPCPEHGFSDSGSALCTCELGTEATRGSTRCEKCSVGWYRDESHEQCTSCPPGAITLGEQSKSRFDCVCDAGKYGYITDTSGQCQQCPPSSYSSVASTELLQCRCLEGFTGPDGGPCNACSIGKYKMNIGPSECIACPSSSTTALVGSTTCLCSPGYARRSSDGSCIACAPGKYKSAISNDAACSQCPASSDSPPAASDVSLCVCSPEFYGILRKPSDACSQCPSNSDRSSTKVRTGGIYDCRCIRGFYGPAGEPCSQCQENTYSDNTGMLNCTDCPLNAVSPAGSTTKSNCTCTSGYIERADGNCDACPAGKYVTSNACTDCPQNSNSPPASDAAHHCLCAEGFYRASQGETVDFVADFGCKQCPSNAKTLGAGSIHISQCFCDVNFFEIRADADSLQCGRCPRNSLSDAGSQSVTDCTCGPGFGLEEGACTACEAGKYKAFRGNNLCEGCEAGKYVARMASTACQICALGTVSPVGSPSSSLCSCPENYYGSRFVGCTPCPAYSESEQGANEIDTECKCRPGYQAIVNSGTGTLTCEACASGFYKDTLGNVDLCLSCPSNAISALGSRSIADCRCPPGFYGADGAACEECPAGSIKAASGDFSCTSCPLNCAPKKHSKWYDQDAEVCECAAGFYGRDITEFSVRLENFVPCAPCPADTFKSAPGSHSCTSCPLGTTSNEASFLNTSCKCQEMFFGPDAGPCTPCPYGTFKNTIGSAECKCIAGSTRSEPGEPCFPCMAGKYKASETSCQNCPSFSDSERSSDSVYDCKCRAGRYAFVNESSGEHSCVLCPANSYSDVGSEQLHDCFCNSGFYAIDADKKPGTCVNCPNHSTSEPRSTAIENCKCYSGYFSQVVGAWGGSTIRCNACPPGSVSPYGSSMYDDCICDQGFTGFDGGPCFECPAGKFKDSLGESECSTCPSYTTSSKISTSITDCTCEVHFTGPDGGECVPCGQGLFNYFGGNATCTKCRANAVMLANGECSCQRGFKGPDNAECEACPAGTFKSLIGSAECTDCPFNSWSPPGSSGCSCNAGYFRDAERACASCTAGTYKISFSDEPCTRCPESSTSSPASVSLSDCKCGQGLSLFFADESTDRFECRACVSPHAYPLAITGVCLCNAGFTGDDNGLCAACAAGTYKDKRGSSPCISCAPFSTSLEASTVISQCLCNAGYSYAEGLCQHCERGYYKSSSGNFACSKCEKGTYSHKTAQSVCTSCPSDSTSPLSSISVLQCTCSPGYSGADGSVCIPCDPGTFKSLNGTSSCISCDTGKFAALLGSTQCFECTSCPPGQYAKGCSELSDGTCHFCRKGTYKSIKGTCPCDSCPQFSESPLGSLSVDDCLCAPGFFAEASAASNVCTACPPGRSTFFGSKSPFDCNCVPGTAEDANGFCQPCAAGKYKDDLALTTCLECPAGKFGLASGSDTSDVCTECDSGTYQANSGSSSCTACPLGTFSADPGASSESSGCFFCPIGQYQLPAASGSTTTCGDCPVCGVGRFRDGCRGRSVGKCTMCAPGTFKDTIGSETCTECRENQNSQKGSVRVNNCTCNAGFVGIGGASECIACPVDMYKSTSGTSPCLECPKFTTSPSASVDLLQCKCILGYYGAEGKQCLPCDQGFFTDKLGSRECMRCPPNSISEIGSSLCLCNAGFTRGLLDGVCDKCPSGKYKNSVENGACIQCPAFSTSEEGSTECICNKGYTGINVESCTACARGQYKDSEGSAQCIDCPPYSISPEGSSSLWDCKCKSGYAGADGQICDACPADSYKDTEGSAECTACPNFATSAAASTKRAQCICRKGYNGKDGNKCLACPKGKYKPVLGSGTCLLCPANSNSLPASVEELNCECSPGFSGGPTWGVEPVVFEVCLPAPGSLVVPQTMPQSGIFVQTSQGEGINIRPGDLDTSRFEHLVLTVTLLNEPPSRLPAGLAMSSGILRFSGPPSVAFDQPPVLKISLVLGRRASRRVLTNYTAYFIYAFVRDWKPTGPHFGSEFKRPGWRARIEEEIDADTGVKRRFAVATIPGFATYAVLAENCHEAEHGVQRNRCRCVHGYAGEYDGSCVECGQRVFWVNPAGELQANGVGSCVSLSLSRMGVKTIPPPVFGEQQSVVSIDLSHNLLTMMPAKTFVGLGANLVSLDLSGNSIHTLVPSTFQGLDNLTNLDLSSNNLTSLPLSLLENTKVASLQVTGNRLECTFDAECFSGTCSYQGLCTTSCRTYEDLDSGCLGMCSWKLGSRCFPGERCNSERTCAKLPAQPHWLIEQFLNLFVIGAILWEMGYVIRLCGGNSDAGSDDWTRKKDIDFEKDIWTKALGRLHGFWNEQPTVQLYIVAKFVVAVVVCIKFNGSPENEGALPLDPMASCVSNYFDHMLMGIACVLECLLDYLDVKYSVLSYQHAEKSVKREVFQLLTTLSMWVVATRISWDLCETRYLKMNAPGGSELHIYVVPMFSFFSVLALALMSLRRFRKMKTEKSLAQADLTKNLAQERENELENVQIDAQVGLYSTFYSTGSHDSTTSDKSESGRAKAQFIPFAQDLQKEDDSGFNDDEDKNDPGALRLFHLLRLRRSVSGEMSIRHMSEPWAPSTPFVVSDMLSSAQPNGRRLQQNDTPESAFAHFKHVDLESSVRNDIRSSTGNSVVPSTAISTGETKVRVTTKDLAALVEFNKAFPLPSPTPEPTLTFAEENRISRIASGFTPRTSTPRTPLLSQPLLSKAPSRPSSVARLASRPSSDANARDHEFSSPQASKANSIKFAEYSAVSRIIFGKPDDDLESETIKVARAATGRSGPAATRTSLRVPARANSQPASRGSGTRPGSGRLSSRASSTHSMTRSNATDFSFAICKDTLEARILDIAGDFERGDL